MPEREQLESELRRRLQPALTRLNRQRRIYALATGLNWAWRVAAALVVIDLWSGRLSPLTITLVSLGVGFYRAWRRRGRPAGMADAAAAMDRQANLKDRVVTAWANCQRPHWSPLVTHQVADALAHLSAAGSLSRESANARRLILASSLLSGILALVWLEPLVVVYLTQTMSPASATRSIATEPPDAGDVVRGYRSARRLDPGGTQTDSTAVAETFMPAEEVVTRRYFELMERGADAER